MFYRVLISAISIFTLTVEPCQAQCDGLPPNTVIIPATDFLHEVPKGDIISDALDLGATWIYNNTALVLKSPSNLMTWVSIPAMGTYYLYTRSQGTDESSFKIAVNDKITEAAFGNEKLIWKRGEAFQLQAGINRVKITRINPGAAVDVIVLSQNQSLKEEDIKHCQLNSDVKLLKEYKIPESNAVKFGDVNGDGLTDFMVLTRDYSAHVFDNSGRALWSWKAPDIYTKERSEFEAPGVLWDFDGDGRAEVVHWRMTGQQEWLTIADGQTGKVLSKVLWPVKLLPHVYYNFRLAIGQLTRNTPSEIVAFTDMGGEIRVDAYSSSLRHLWNHTEIRKKDNLGHYVYPIDFDNDGIDEVLVGSLLLDARGKMIWNRFDLSYDNHDHADNYKFGDVDGDGRLDIVTANSETGVFIYQGLTGEILWQNVAEHCQQIEVGKFLKNRAGPQVVVGARTYGNRAAGEPYLSSQLYWFSNRGEMLFKWPGTPINGNPDFVKGDWYGTGQDQLFWFKFKIKDNGEGEFYFPDPVFHMFDFNGNGAAEVITLRRDTLRVYGSQSAHLSEDKKKNLRYLQRHVVNHTHY
jgi:hypothetical protein